MKIVLEKEKQNLTLLLKRDLKKEKARWGLPKTINMLSLMIGTTTPDEVVDIAVMKLERNKISALPIVDANEHLVGLLNAVDLGKLVGKRWTK